MEPSTLGPYTILRPLGAGGAGAVYEVAHPEWPRRLALKRLHVSEPGKRARFEREATLLARVRHPNVVVVHDLGVAPDGALYLVTDLVEGPTLAELATPAGLPPERAVTIVRDLADAVAALHAEGILHRDIKPENVILRADGVPVLIDFGLAWAQGVAALTETGALTGTPAYMAPEQFAGGKGGELSPRTDVYGLGGVLYTVLTGRTPYDAESLFELIDKVNAGALRLPRSLPPRLQRLLKRALATAPEERPSLDELRAMLDEVREAPRPNPSPLWLGLALTAAVGATALGASALREEGPVRPPRTKVRATVTPPPIATPTPTPSPRSTPAPELPPAPRSDSGFRAIEDSLGARPVFTPDGGSLVYTSRGHVIAVDTTSGARRSLAKTELALAPLAATEGAEVVVLAGTRGQGGVLSLGRDRYLLRGGRLAPLEVAGTLARGVAPTGRLALVAGDLLTWVPSREGEAPTRLWRAAAPELAWAQGRLYTVAERQLHVLWPAEARRTLDLPAPGASLVDEDAQGRPRIRLGGLLAEPQRYDEVTIFQGNWIPTSAGLLAASEGQVLLASESGADVRVRRLRPDLSAAYAELRADTSEEERSAARGEGGAVLGGTSEDLTALAATQDQALVLVTRVLSYGFRQTRYARVALVPLGGDAPPRLLEPLLRWTTSGRLTGGELGRLTGPGGDAAALHQGAEIWLRRLP